MKPRNFKEAAWKSHVERWLPMSKAESTEDMTKIEDSIYCALCKLQLSRGHFPTGDCGRCPVNDVGFLCCAEYSKWSDAIRNSNIKEAIIQAKALDNRLIKIAEG